VLVARAENNVYTYRNLPTDHSGVSFIIMDKLFPTRSGCLGQVLQLTASPWTTEASTRERWQFGAL